MKPNGLTRAYTDSDPIRPMFGTLRGLDRTHPAVVAGVHVAHLQPGTLTGQTAGAQRRQPALVGQPRQRVVLVHELGELAGAEELLDRSDPRADFDQRLRRIASTS